jgi:hypothetical protein
MRIAARGIPRWWLMLAAAALVLGLPLFLIATSTTHHLSRAVLGPPAIWERPWHTPPIASLTGSYIETSRVVDSNDSPAKATLQLHANGSMEAHGLLLDWPDTCIVSGTGTWATTGGDRIILYVHADTARNRCDDGSYKALAIAGQSKPYRFYWNVGNPDSVDRDSNEGIWLAPSH